MTMIRSLKLFVVKVNKRPMVKVAARDIREALRVFFASSDWELLKGRQGFVRSAVRFTESGEVLTALD